MKREEQQRLRRLQDEKQLQQQPTHHNQKRSSDTPSSTTTNKATHGQNSSTHRSPSPGTVSGTPVSETAGDLNDPQDYDLSSEEDEREDESISSPNGTPSRIPASASSAFISAMRTSHQINTLEGVAVRTTPSVAGRTHSSTFMGAIRLTNPSELQQRSQLIPPPPPLTYVNHHDHMISMNINTNEMQQAESVVAPVSNSSSPSPSSMAAINSEIKTEKSVSPLSDDLFSFHSPGNTIINNNNPGLLQPGKYSHHHAPASPSPPQLCHDAKCSYNSMVMEADQRANNHTERDFQNTTKRRKTSHSNSSNI